MNKIVANDGYLYTKDMKIFAKTLYLGINDNINNYLLVTTEVAEKIIVDKDESND